MSGGVFKLISAGGSNVGSVRRLNEDAFLQRPEIGLWAVADGMGGHQAGDLASQTVINGLLNISTHEDAARLLADVREAIDQANTVLLQEAARRAGGTVIGTTIVALMASERHFFCLWAGDSRLYRWRNGDLVQLSRDHSHVQELVDAGVLTPDQAERHPMANVITRAVGTREPLVLDQVTDELAAGDIYLCCTDGLSKMVPDSEIATIMSQTCLQDQPSALIAAALAHGGNDNVTAVIVGVRPDV